MAIDVLFVAGATATLGARLVIGAKFSTLKREIITTLPFVILGFTFVLGAFLRATLLGVRVAYPLQTVSIPVQVSWFIVLLVLVSDSLDYADLPTWAAEQFPAWGIPVIVIGVCYALGVPILGYGPSQYVTAAVLVLLGIAMVVTDVTRSYKLYAGCVVLLMLATPVYYYWIVTIETHSFSVDALSAAVRRYPFIGFVLSFTLIQGTAYSVFTQIAAKRMTKAIFAILLASFTYQHPELQESITPIVKDILAYMPAVAHTGMAAYVTVRVLRATVTLV